MNILFSLDKYRKGYGGAVFSARGIVKALVESGHNVRILEAGRLKAHSRDEYADIKTFPMHHPWSFHDGHLTMLNWSRQWEPIVRKEIESFRPGLILTQNVLTPASITAARKAGIPGAIFFRGYCCLSPLFFKGKDALSCPEPRFKAIPLRYKLKWPLIQKSLDLYAAAYQDADIIIANSEYTSLVIERFFSRSAEVLYPVLDLELKNQPPSESSQGSLLFIKPSRTKGVKAMLDLVRSLPEKNFTAAGITSPRIRRHVAFIKNLHDRGWINNREDLYGDTSLLLGPSLLPEPFGRIYVEAGLRGIPSIASRTGGIPEAVGKGGILLNHHSQITDWKEAVHKALSPQNYAELSRSAFQHARSLLENHNAARLLKILGLPISK